MERKPQKRHLRLVNDNFRQPVPQAPKTDRLSRLAKLFNFSPVGEFTETILDRQLDSSCQSLADNLMNLRSAYDPESNHDIEGRHFFTGLHEIVQLASTFGGDVEKYVRSSLQPDADKTNTALLYDSWSQIHKITQVPDDDNYVQNLLAAVPSPLWLHSKLTSPFVQAVQHAEIVMKILALRQDIEIEDLLASVQTQIAKKGLAIDPAEPGAQKMIGRRVELARAEWLERLPKP